MIQKNIFQTQKSQDFINSRYKLKIGQDSWKEHETKGFKYHFYNDQECDSFIKEHFNDIYDAYQKLPIPVMKADLWRYCVVYHYGGIYADADTHCNIEDLNNIFIKEKQLVGTLENDRNFCNWIFAASAKSPIIKEIIDLSVQRIRSCDNFQVEHITHYLTGPAVYTAGIEKHLNDGTLLENKLKYCKPDHNKILIHEPTNFHKNLVQHLYSGQWENGWVSDANKLTGIQHIPIHNSKDGDYLNSKGMDEFNMGTFKHAASLGGFCFSSQILKDRKIRKESLPFDWLFTNPLEVAHILETDFKHYLDKTQYIDIADIAPDHGGRQAGHKMYHENFFNHKNPRTDEDYQYSVRCVERFRKFLKHPEKKLFIVSYRSGINHISRKFENVGLNKTKVQQELMVLDKTLQSKTQNYSIFCHVNYKNQFNYPSSSLFKLSNHIILHEYHSTILNEGLGYGNSLDQLTFDNLFNKLITFE